jgi:hypothetical protein
MLEKATLRGRAVLLDSRAIGKWLMASAGKAPRRHPIAVSAACSLAVRKRISHCFVSVVQGVGWYINLIHGSTETRSIPFLLMVAEARDCGS